MFRLLAKAIFGASARTADDPWAAIIDAAIEKAVDATDPRIRALYGYQRRLREPVTRAARFVNELGERFPPAVHMSRATFGSDARTRAFFSSAARLQEVFSTSREVQDFCRAPGSGSFGEVYAALAMKRSERQVLAPVRHGDRVRREVERTLVSFDEHRVLLPAPDEARLRRQVKERGFTTLLECALARMVARRERAEALKRRRALLRTKHRAIRSSRSGLDALAPATSPTVDVARLARELEEAERALNQEAVSDDSLERCLGDLCTTLEQPEDYISLEPLARRLTAMNYLLPDGDDSEPGEEVTFMQVQVRGRAAACAVLVRYPTPELRDGEFYRDRMRRALGAGS